MIELWRRDDEARAAAHGEHGYAELALDPERGLVVKLSSTRCCRTDWITLTIDELHRIVARAEHASRGELMTEATTEEPR